MSLISFDVNMNRCRLVSHQRLSAARNIY